MCKPTLSPKRKRFDSPNEMEKSRWLKKTIDVSFSFHEIATPPRKKSTRKTVSFDVVEEVHEVMNRHEYTSDEKKACWFTTDDFYRRKRVMYAEARLIDWGHFHTIEFQTTPRGLEGRTEKGENRKRQQRINAYQAVFDEIEFQDETGFVDETAVAASYADACAPCSVYAQLLAQFDEVEARIIYNDPLAILSDLRSSL